MQYSLPQFVEVEDQILPHLTIKQFLMLVAVAIMGLIYWAMFGFTAPFFVLVLITLAIAVPIAFVKFNGRPIMANIPGLVHYFATPKRRVFIHSAGKEIIRKRAEAEAAAEAAAETKAETPAASRLRKLAYYLDEKAAEEDRLLRTGEYSKKWLNEV